MKKTVCIILILSSMFLTACGSTVSPAAPASGEYGDQNAFLKDMAKGISDRLSIDKDESKMSTEERSEYYLECVNAELKQIEKYTNVVFADQKFNELAHEYISACQIQRTGAENMRNDDLYNALWTGGYSVRAGLINHFYMNYSLPITSEQAAKYPANGSSGSGKVTYSLDGQLDLSTGMTMYSDDMVTYDEIRISKDNGQVLLNDQNIMITLKSLERRNNGDYYVNMTISNSTEGDRVACYLSKGYIDDFQVSMYHTHGYDFVDAGKKGNTYSNIMNDGIKAAGKTSFKELRCNLYVLATPGGGKGYYIACVPLIIEEKAFH